MSTYKVTLYVYIEAESKTDAATEIDQVLEGGIATSNAHYLIGSIREQFPAKKQWVVHYRIDQGGNALCRNVSSARGHRTRVIADVTCRACQNRLRVVASTSGSGDTPSAI